MRIPVGKYGEPLILPEFGGCGRVEVDFQGWGTAIMIAIAPVPAPDLPVRKGQTAIVAGNYCIGLCSHLAPAGTMIGRCDVVM
jgi:hypothetical protein